MKDFLLYKYRDWNAKYGRDILTKSEVFMASPKSFNDPFDCMIFEDYSLLKSDEEKETFIRESIELQGNRPELKVNLDKFEKFLREKLKNPETLNESQEFFEELQVSNNYGIFSTSLETYDSLLMWSHYANHHKGYNIGLSYIELKESGLFPFALPIKYDANPPQIHPNGLDQIIDKIISQLTFKHEDWHYENEFRFVTSNVNSLSDNQRRIKVPKSCIKEINLGLKITPEDKEEILMIARKRKINIYQMKKVPLKFQLTRVLI